MESGARRGEVVVGGLPYSLVFDRMLRGLHRKVAEQVPEGHSCVDICCGTGGLTFQIARRAPRVVGVDISPSMIRRAELLRRRRGLDHVSFLEGDATDLSHLAVDELDCGSVCMGLHEMPTDVRDRVLPELLRVVRRVVICDFRIPMPRNGAGIRNRVIEFLGGPAHFTGFLDYKRRGGLDALLAPLGATVERRRTLDAGTLDLCVIHR